MTSTTFWAWLKGASFAVALPLWCWAQTNGPVWVAKPMPIRVKQGAVSAVTIKVQLANGYHVNTNTPLDQYLIPLRLSWEALPLEVAGVDYPKGKLEKYDFSEKPLSVYSGDFDLVTRFKAPAGAPRGTKMVTGKLRYQACTATTCYPPKTINVELPVDVY